MRPKMIFIALTMVVLVLIGALIATMYAPARFFLDFLRVPPEAGGDARYFDLTPAQYLSVVLLGVGIYFWVKIKDAPPAVWREYKPDSAPTDSK